MPRPSPHCFPHRVTVSSVATTNTNGGKVPVLTALHTSIMARVQTEHGRQRQDPGERQRENEVTHRVLTPIDVSDVREGMVVTFGSKKLTVVHTRDEGGAGCVWQMYCKEQRNP